MSRFPILQLKSTHIMLREARIIDNENIKKLRAWRGGLKEVETLAERSSLEIDKANQTAGDAQMRAQQAEQQATDTQSQLDNIVLENGDSEAEVVQARGPHNVLRDRFKTNEEGITQAVEGIQAERDVILNRGFERHASYGATGEVLPFPSWFTWNAPINVYRKDGLYFTDFDVSALKPAVTGTTYYVDKVLGETTNSGLTEEDPLTSVRAAVNKGDAGEIWVRPGTYQYEDVPKDIPNQNLSIKAWGEGEVIFSVHHDHDWELATDASYTYRTERSNTDWVWDAKYPDASGDYAMLTLQASISAVESNPGSYYISGDTVYVHPQDSRDLTEDTDIRLFLNAPNLRMDGGATLYVEHVRFEGGRWYMHNTAEDLEPLLLAKHCAWKYIHGSQAGGCEIDGGDAYVQNSVAAWNVSDGFNYHVGNGRTNRVIEVDCIGRYNGNRQNRIQSDNGSTMHDGGQIIRVNGAYFGNDGPNVADVSDGTQSWNLGCLGIASRSEVNGADFRARELVNMKLDGCITDNEADIVAENGAEIETNEVITNAAITKQTPMVVAIPSAVNGMVKALNQSISTIGEQLPGLQQEINNLKSKTISSGGANSLGAWVRFADGTQIAYTNFISLNGATFRQEGALYRSDDVYSVTLPVSFVGNISPSVNIRRTGGSSAVNAAWPVMYSSDSFFIFKAEGSALDSCGYIATVIGRWK